MNSCALIMAGGHGTRFWPWSSELLPKQFLPLADPERSLLQQTFDRVAQLTGADRVLVLTNREFFAVVRTQLPNLAAENIIAEPVLRDTAAAIAYGSAVAATRFPNAVQLVLPADHEISPDERFCEVLGYAARAAAADGKLYTVGIRPRTASVAYGYLRRGAALLAEPGHSRAEVAEFVEKPDEATAGRYVDSGDYLWNAGMFVWLPGAVRAAMQQHLTRHAALIDAVPARLRSADFEPWLHDAFLKLPKISIDYGIMQAEGDLGNVRTVEGDFTWNDLGGWRAFGERIPADAAGNHVFGHALAFDGTKWRERWYPREPRAEDKDEDLTVGDVLTMEATNNIVFNNRKGHRIALYGVSDLAVIHTHRATLITPRDRVEAIKPLVSALPDNSFKGGRVTPQRVEKPWGWELWWGWTDDFAGKTLFLRQGKRFSLQYHVVKEEVIYVHQGRVRLETATGSAPLCAEILEPGQAVHVEPGRLHRIEALEDSLLFESSLPFLWDVVRVADDFGREGTRAAEVPPDPEKQP